MNTDILMIAQHVKNNIQKSNNARMPSGLMSGKTGLIIYFYHIARLTDNNEYEHLADELLDNVFSNANDLTPTYFENGLAGIGWGIEYLVQNGFAEGDTDIILEEADNKVFNTLCNDNIMSFELTNGLTGYLFYLINRLKKPLNPNSMAQRINRELLILTINKLDEVVTSQFPSIIKEMNFDLFWRFPVMIYGLVQAFELNIYNEKIRCMINQWLMNLEAYIPTMHINRLYLTTALSLLNKIMPNKRLERQIQILLFATDFRAINKEIDPEALNLRYGWPGIVLLLNKASLILPKKYQNHSLIIPTSNEIVSKYKSTLEKFPDKDFKTNPKQFGLSEGLVGIGLMELLYPGILQEK